MQGPETPPDRKGSRFSTEPEPTDQEIRRAWLSVLALVLLALLPFLPGLYFFGLLLCCATEYP